MHVEVVALPRGIDKARAKLRGSDQHHCTTENDVTQTKERDKMAPYAFKSISSLGGGGCVKELLSWSPV